MASAYDDRVKSKQFQRKTQTAKSDLGWLHSHGYSEGPRRGGRGGAPPRNWSQEHRAGRRQAHAVSLQNHTQILLLPNHDSSYLDAERPTLIPTNYNPCRAAEAGSTAASVRSDYRIAGD